MLLTVQQLAYRYQVTDQTIRTWVKRRNMPHFRVGPTIRFNDQEINEWAKKQADLKIRNETA